MTGYVIWMVRLPVWMVGAIFGGWLAADAYMRLMWKLQTRAVNGGE